MSGQPDLPFVLALIMLLKRYPLRIIIWSWDKPSREALFDNNFFSCRRSSTFFWFNFWSPVSKTWFRSVPSSSDIIVTLTYFFSQLTTLTYSGFHNGNVAPSASSNRKSSLLACESKTAYILRFPRSAVAEVSCTGLSYLFYAYLFIAKWKNFINGRGRAEYNH